MTKKNVEVSINIINEIQNVDKTLKTQTTREITKVYRNSSKAHCASLGGQQDNYEKIIFQQISVLIYFFVWNPLYPLV